MTPVASSGTATVTLPTDEQILIVREFDAPRHLVYKAWTTPELIKRWWSGKRGNVTIAEVDLRVGGTSRCVMPTKEGLDAPSEGGFREMGKTARLIKGGVDGGAPAALGAPPLC